MSRKKVRELEERCEKLQEQALASEFEKSGYIRELCCVRKQLSFANCERDKYKELYADEMQKRLELAEMARKLEEDNRKLRHELAEVLGDG